jgi:hypothetical protein
VLLPAFGEDEVNMSGLLVCLSEAAETGKDEDSARHEQHGVGQETAATARKLLLGGQAGLAFEVERGWRVSGSAGLLALESVMKYQVALIPELSGLRLR